MLPPVFQALKASGAVKNIVGQNPPRIYRHGSAPQDTSQPYITWFALPAPENTLSELPLVDRVMVQIDAWHQTDSGVDLLADAIRDAIEPHAQKATTLVDEQEPSTKLYRVSQQFVWWLDR